MSKYGLRSKKRQCDGAEVGEKTSFIKCYVLGGARKHI